MPAPQLPRMSAPGLAAPGFRPGLPSRLTSWLPVLLPFAALGLLPWWVCLALSASLALARLGDDARSVGVLLVLLAAAAVSGPLLLGTAPDRLLHSGDLFAQAAVVGLLALASVRALEAGQRRGLLLPAAALLLFPNAVGLGALILAALGLAGAETRPRLQFSQGSGRSLAAVLGVALLLGGAMALLGTVLHAAPQKSAPPPASAARTPSRGQPEAQTPPPQSGTAARVRAAPASQLTPPQDPFLLRPLVPVTGLLAVICMLLLLRHTRLKRGEQRSTWTDYLAVAALALTLFMVGVIGAGARPGGVLGGAARQAPLPGAGGTATAAEFVSHTPNWLPALLNVGLVFATLFFAAASVYLYLSLRAAGGERTAQPLPPQKEAIPSEPLPPLHRVRLAWRGVEAAFGQAGLARVASETPEDYADRLAGLLPAAAGGLHTLTRLYLPVRYGGELSEQDADQAEASAEGIQAVLRDSNAVS